jgi:hypothetical protein
MGGLIIPDPAQPPLTGLSRRPYKPARITNLRVEMSTSKRIGVSVLEAGWVLGKTESQVRRLLKKGALHYVLVPRWIDPESVRALFDDDELQPEALEALLHGGLDAPRPVRRYAEPRPIFPYLLPHLLTDATLVSHSCGADPCGESCPQIGSRFYDSYASPWE